MAAKTRKRFGGAVSDAAAAKNPSCVPSKRLAWPDFTLMGVLACVAFLLRWPQMQESLWVDELHTAWAVAGGLAKLPERCAIGNQSPVWFLLPWASTQLFGLNEFALRLPSLLASVAIVPAVYCLTRWWSASTVAALVAALLATCDAQFLTFAAEARPYAWVQLVGVLQAMLFWRCLRLADRKTRTAWIVLSALLFYMHYTAILLVVAEVVYFAGWWVRRMRRPTKENGATPYSARAFGVDLLLLAVALLPAAGHLLEVAGRRDNWTQYISAPNSWNSWMLFPLATYLVLPSLLAYGSIFADKIRGVSRPISAISNKLGPILFCLCWALAPLVTVWLTTVLDIAALWLARYVIVCAAAVVILPGLLCAVPTRRVLRVLCGTLTLGAALFIAGPQWTWWQCGQPVPPRGEDWRGAVSYINADDAAADWPILLRPDLIEANALPQSDDPLLPEYCLLPIRSIYRVDSSRTAIPMASYNPGDIREADIESLQNANGVWLVTRGGAANAEATFRLVLRTLARAGMRAETKNTQTFGRVWVMRVEFTAAD